MKYPKDENIRVLQASIADNLGQYELAENELKQAIEDCNDTLNAQLQLAGLYRRTNRDEDAIQIYEAMLQKYPDSVKPRIGLSERYLENSKVVEKLVQKAIADGITVGFIEYHHAA